MLRSPVLRAVSLFHSGVEGAFLDPSKHAVMNKMPHNIYIDYWPVGQYPQTYVIGSLSPKTYQPQIEQILANALAEKYNVKFNADLLPSQTWDYLTKTVFKSKQSLREFQEYILRTLAIKIFIKESRWTWPKEQEHRHYQSIQMINFKQLKTVEDFIDKYNEVIHFEVSRSHFGLSPKIEQTETAQEKHFYNEMNSKAVGIQELKDQAKAENQTIVNRFMNLLHSS